MTNKIPNAKLDFMDIANNLSVTALFGIVSFGGLISGNPIGLVAGLAGVALTVYCAKNMKQKNLDPSLD